MKAAKYWGKEVERIERQSVFFFPRRHLVSIARSRAPQVKRFPHLVSLSLLRRIFQTSELSMNLRNFVILSLERNYFGPRRFRKHASGIYRPGYTYTSLIFTTQFSSAFCSKSEHTYLSDSNQYVT